MLYENSKNSISLWESFFLKKKRIQHSLWEFSGIKSLPFLISYTQEAERLPNSLRIKRLCLQCYALWWFRFGKVSPVSADSI